MAAIDYRALAAKAREEADASKLDNVRKRCLRAEAVSVRARGVISGVD